METHSRKIRYEYIGDKLAPRSAQLGTVGLLMNLEERIFRSDLIPDITVNLNNTENRVD